MESDPRKVNQLQKIAVEESRLGIPLLIGFDVIHGLRSVYPIAIAEAGSFDDDLMERTAQMAARESRAYGIGWNFAPMLDVARDSRWGCVSEGPGESKEVTLSLRKCDMGFYDNQGKYVDEDGLFRIYVGGNSRDCLAGELRISF